MMYDRDYILRMVREFATFLARVVRARDGRSDDRTVADLNGLAQQFVGLGLDVLEALPTDQLVTMLSLGGALDANRAYAAGRLLDERARLSRDPAFADAVRAKALRLLVDAGLAFGGYLNEEHAEAVHRVADELLAAAAEPPPRLLCGLLELHLEAGEAARLAATVRAIAARSPEEPDPLAALRIALRGACVMVAGRVQEALLAATVEDGTAASS